MSQEQEIAVMKREKAQNWAQTVIQGIIAVALLFLILDKDKGKSSPPTIENTASPQFSNQVTTGSELDHIKDKAEIRGYYYQSEFAEVMGVSEKTIQRRIDDGRLSPPPYQDTEGRVAIPLDVEILPAR